MLAKYFHYNKLTSDKIIRLTHNSKFSDGHNPVVGFRLSATSNAIACLHCSLISDVEFRCFDGTAIHHTKFHKHDILHEWEENTTCEQGFAFLSFFTSNAFLRLINDVFIPQKSWSPYTGCP